MEYWIPVSIEVPVELTAIADPLEGRVVDWGDIPQEGDSVTAQVTQGERTACRSELDLEISLAPPAVATGTATIRLTDVSPPTVEGELVSYAAPLPEVGDRLDGSARKDRTSVELSRDGLTIEVHLDHKLQVTGTVTVRITERDGTTYRGDVVEYQDPPLVVGHSNKCDVSRNKQRAELEVDGRTIPISLTDEISRSGYATVTTDAIEDEVYGYVEGKIDPVGPSSDSAGPDVDLRDLSKL